MNCIFISSDYVTYIIHYSCIPVYKPTRQDSIIMAVPSSYQIPNDVTIKLNGTGFIPLGNVSYSEAYFEEYSPDMLISRSKNNNSFGKLTEFHVHTNSGRPQFIRKPDSTTYSKGFDVKGEYLTV